MPRRSGLLQEAFRSGAGVHQRCRSGERQRLNRDLDADIDEHFENANEASLGNKNKEAYAE